MGMASTRGKESHQCKPEKKSPVCQADAQDRFHAWQSPRAGEQPQLGIAQTIVIIPTVFGNLVPADCQRRSSERIVAGFRR
jgi:hypothetical protein